MTRRQCKFCGCTERGAGAIAAVKLPFCPDEPALARDYSILPPGTIVPPGVETFMVPCSWFSMRCARIRRARRRPMSKRASNGMDFSNRPHEQTRSNHATSKGRVGVIHRTEIIELDEAALRLERKKSTAVPIAHKCRVFSSSAR